MTERENVYLGNQNESKASKLKGANKKVRHAKEVAGKEEEKAKEAVGAKQRHLASQRKMKKERDDALAALQEQQKANEKLRAELEVEQSGAPHKRDAAVDANNTVVVIPIQFEVRRIDIQRIMAELGRYQVDMTAYVKTWYKRWCGLKEDGQVPGAGASEEARMKARLYEDMVENANGCVETGAEHDGWRSRRALEAVCRHAKACYNEEG
ncbi:Trafficking protein particle complex subunit 31 [Exserohilum turcicum]